MLKKKTLIWSLIIVLLAVSFGGIVHRWKAETKNTVYEIVVPFEEILTLTEEDTFTLEETLSALRDAGLTGVSFNPVTLSELEEQDVIQIFDEKDLKKALLFSDFRNSLPSGKRGIYVTIPDSPILKTLIEEHFDFETVMVGDVPIYFLPDTKEDLLLNSILGYNEEAIQLVKSLGLDVILRAENDTPINNGQTIQKMVELKDEQTSGILFSGEEAPGYPNMKEMVSYAMQLQEAGYYLYSIEFNELKGLRNLGRTTNYEIVRLHSLDLSGEKSVEEFINQAVRAIKERNIRSVFFHINTDDPGQGFKDAVAFVKGVRDQVPSAFTLGTPAPFEKIPVPSWNVLIVLLAGIVFTYLATCLVRIRWLRLAAVGAMSLLAMLYFLFDKLFFIQLFALAIAVITPAYAVVTVQKGYGDGTKEGRGEIKNITVKYLQALGISIVGIMIVVGSLNGNGFVSGFEMFRGVKLVYVGPIALVALHLFWNDLVNLWKKYGIRILHLEVRYWHLILLLLIAGGGAYYILRTGNSGTVSAIELTFRNMLEDMLYVRPRTKEFLIGFPTFLLALYIMKRNALWGKMLLVLGTIGFLSIMNTFTHLHIPLGISILRTLYSVVFGYLIGLVFIFVYRMGMKWIGHFSKKMTS